MITPETPQIGDRVYATHLPNNPNCISSQCPQVEGIVMNVIKGIITIYNGEAITDVDPTRGWGIEIYPELTGDISGWIPFQRTIADIERLQESDNGSF